MLLQPIIDEQIIIPLNNIAYSLHPSIIGPQYGSSSSSSQTLDAVLQSPEMLSPSHSRRTTPSLQISVSDDSDFPIYTAQRHFVSSPTDTRRPSPRHLLQGYRSDSTEPTDKLGSGDFSRISRDMTLVAGSSQLSLDLSTGLSLLSHAGTTTPSPTCVGHQGTPALTINDIYPVAPENFERYEKRRKM